MTTNPTDAVTQAASKTVEELDLIKGLQDDVSSTAPPATGKTVAGDEEEGKDSPVEEGKEEEGKDESQKIVEGDAQQADTVGGDAKHDKEEKPATTPGTPDKALQKLQQDFASATRRIEELNAKLDAGQTLTPTEKEQAKVAARKIDTLRQALKAKGEALDLLDDGLAAAVAESIIDADQSVDDLRKEHEALKSEVAELKKLASKSSHNAHWGQVKTIYKEVAVEEVWTKALDDAQKITGIGPDEADPRLRDTLRRSATHLFHERAGAAAKSIAAKKEAPANNGKTTPKPPVTPAGARVTQSSGLPDNKPLSPEEEEMRLIRSLQED